VGNNEVYSHFGNVTYVSLCAGDNIGYFSSSHRGYAQSYNPGQDFGLANGHASKIDNEGWNGNENETCAYAF
jgi:hypothetical protein